MSSRRTAPPDRKDRRGRRGKHEKIHGYIQEIDGKKWWAILHVNGHEYFAEMNEVTHPLPDYVDQPGYLFTIHWTKAGDQYIFWPPARKLTSTRRKRIRREARELWNFFKDVDGE